MHKKTSWIVAAIFLIIFSAVAWMTAGATGDRLDAKFSTWADGITGGAFHKLMEIASVIGSSEMILLVTILVGLGLLIKRKWRQFFFFFVVSVGGVAVNFIVKTIVQRARPGDEVSYIEVFNYQMELQSYSFPSGHTMRATILCLFFIYIAYYFGKRLFMQWFAYVVYGAILIAVALSRIVLDAHYATDILGAIALSFAWFFVCMALFHKPKRASDTFSFY